MAQLKIILFTSKELKDGTSPIMLRLTKNRKRKYFALGYSCEKDQWDEENGLFKKNFPNSKRRNRILVKELFRAEDVLDRLVDLGKEFTLDDFRNEYIGVKSKDVFLYFDKIIDELKKNGKIGNANAYQDSKRALSNFHKNKSLNFNEVDYPFLKKFENDFLQRGVKPNSISVYMRTLRALFNKAIKEKQCRESDYPFKEYTITHLKNETAKRAISKEEIQLIKNYEPPTGNQQEDSKNYFLFSYYAMGMNFTDMAKLKWSDISDGRINYIRSKTGKGYSIKILPPAQEILRFYNKFNPNNSYVFPILNDSIITPERIKHTITIAIRLTNKHLKKIGQVVGIEKPLTTYVARHSWATVMKRSGVSTTIISEGMGHKSESITQVYLDSFENSTLDKANENIL